MSDAEAVEAARRAYERARHRLAYAHSDVVDHQREMDAHHEDGSVDYPYDDGPWDAADELAKHHELERAEAEAKSAFETARDDYRAADVKAFEATAKEDLAKVEAEYREQKTKLDGFASTTESSDFWNYVGLLPTIDRLEGELGVARATVEFAADAPPVLDPTLDTGHYDDGHGFGWGQDPPPSVDTGHYDDGHSFGWPTKKKIAVGAGIVAGILAAVAAIVAAVGGGGSSKPAADSKSSSSTVSESSGGVSNAPSSPEAAALPTNTVLDGCIAIDPQGSTTVLHEGFVIANPAAGDYTATFAKGPTGATSGTGTANGNLVVTDIRIRAFGTYDGLTLTAPDGTPIALGPIASQLPLDINAQTDKPNGCNPAALKLPTAGAGRTVDADHAAIQTFLPDFSHAMQVADSAFLAHALDPAVLARYGQAQCLADLSAVPADPTANFALRGFSAGPVPFTYASDGQSTIVPNTYTVAVARTANGTTSDTELHLSVDRAGAVHWFTDCTH